MNKFFEAAIMMTIAITFVNGAIVAFAEPLIGLDIMDDEGNPTGIADIRVTSEDVNNLIEGASGETAKSGEMYANIRDFVGQLVGSIPVVGEIGQAVGGIWMMLTTIYNFGTAYTVVLQLIFGDMGALWTFMAWTVIPMINLLQILSIVYLLAYAVSAVRGGAG